MKFKLSTIFLSALFAFWLNVRGQTEQKLLRFLCMPVKYVDARGATQKNVSQFHSCAHRSNNIPWVHSLPKTRAVQLGSFFSSLQGGRYLYPAVTVPFVCFYSRVLKLACR